MSLPSFFLYFFVLCCHQHIAVCFVFDLLQRVVVLPIISFFVVFVLTIQMTKFDRIESSYQILFVSMHMKNLRYFIIVGL